MKHKIIARIIFADFLKKEPENFEDYLEALYELEYKYHTLKNNPGNWEGNPKRYENILAKMEDLIKDIASEIADDLIEVFDDWLSKHALLDANAWAKSRMDDAEDYGDDLMDVIEGEYNRYVSDDFDKDVANSMGKFIEDSRSLSQFLEEYGQEEKNRLIDDKMEEEGENYNEDEFEEELEYLDDPEEVWKYIMDNWGASEAMDSLFPDYVKDDLGFAIYKHLVFPAWLDKWKSEGIEATRERVEESTSILHDISSSSVDDIGKITVGINRALNEAHQTGDMLEYVGERHDISKHQLDDLSNRDVGDWKGELNEIGLKVAKESEMREEDGAVFYDSEEEALQHLADLTRKSIKIPNKAEPTVANEDVAEDEDEDSMTSAESSLTQGLKDTVDALDDKSTKMKEVIKELDSIG